MALLSLYECFILESGGIRSKSGGIPRISGGNRAREEKMREAEIKEENIYSDFKKVVAINSQRAILTKCHQLLGP